MLHRLRERGVLRVAASYAVIAWLLLQIADVTFEPLGVPRWVMIALITAAVLGFPVTRPSRSSISSARPSEKYSCSGSLLRFSNGRTAIAGGGGLTVPEKTPAAG
jgi:hypothetical protein